MLERLPTDRQISRRRGEQGFSLLELVLIVTVVCTLTGIAVGITANIVRMARGESGAQELDSFLKRHREMAISRRRDIEIRFIEPNIVESAERPVRDPDDEDQDLTPVVLERMTFEGRIEYWAPEDVPDTPDAFGNETPVQVGGVGTVMLSSEGSFVTGAGDPVNATISLGIEGDDLSATAVTVLGTTATIKRWRWNGGSWMR